MRSGYSVHWSVVVPAAIVSAGATAAPARTEVCQPATERDIVGLFDRWNASLQTGDPRKVVFHYAPRAPLLAEAPGQLRLSVSDKEQFYSQFLRKEPVGIVDRRSVEIGCNSALDTGSYTFHFADGSTAQALYTFTYRWERGRWIITSHLTSTLPEKP